jgi:hypothetical protein
MSMKHLGPSFDIHTGGVDLIFPHHEDEIAQSEGRDRQAVRPDVAPLRPSPGERTKMAKSTGNIARVRGPARRGRSRHGAPLRADLRPLPRREQLEATSRLAAAAALSTDSTRSSPRSRVRRGGPDDATCEVLARATRVRRGARRRPEHLAALAARLRPRPGPEPADRCAVALHGRRRAALATLRSFDEVLAVLPDPADELDDGRAGCSTSVPPRGRAGTGRPPIASATSWRRSGSPSRTRATASAGGGSWRRARG